MRGPLMLLCLALAAVPVAAEAPQWRRARTVEIRVDSFAFSPATVRLEADRPARLLLVNQGEQDHRVSSAAFFAGARIHPRHAARAGGGTVAVRAGEVVEVALVPRAGRYRLRSRNLLYRVLGMSGEIIVE